MDSGARHQPNFELYGFACGIVNGLSTHTASSLSDSREFEGLLIRADLQGVARHINVNLPADPTLPDEICCH